MAATDELEGASPAEIAAFGNVLKTVIQLIRFVPLDVAVRVQQESRLAVLAQQRIDPGGSIIDVAGLEVYAEMVDMFVDCAIRLEALRETLEESGLDSEELKRRMQLFLAMHPPENENRPGAEWNA